MAPGKIIRKLTIRSSFEFHETPQRNSVVFDVASRGEKETVFVRPRIDVGDGIGVCGEFGTGAMLGIILFFMMAVLGLGQLILIRAKDD